ncbi:Cysteine-rich protein 2-binding protein [Lunasporangiospora selenospora]|uniref:Cysteine-rich protein 2-binding protein n=1 Tax=Lunasporangiospora selenospora TaxID=979761 RepID=A0A9P6G2V8_9FUNG|nr:Cysteine-rich protein 2-binding protein [Lunasporangiospora selenospora]
MDAHPEQKYFRWKEEICKFIDDYWTYLLPDKDQSPTWNNTVASVLSVQNHIFLSGVETKGASGWWTLIEKAPPDRNRKLKSKNKSVSKSGPARPSIKNKEKKVRPKGAPVRKKTKFDETSSDDDFHTSAKPRPLSTAPTTRIKSRQFSLSSGSSLSSAGDSDDSLDDDDNFWKSEDDEEEFRPLVQLHGIPACIHHHFNPSGLDFSAGPIYLEEVFRLTDLIDEHSPARLVHRINHLVAASTGGKKKRRKSAGEIKRAPEPVLEVEQSSDDQTDHSDEDISDDQGGSVNEQSDLESDAESDEEDDENNLEDDELRERQGRAIATKRTSGKRYDRPSISHKKSGNQARRGSVVTIAASHATGGKYGRRKSSLKDMSLFDIPRKSKKNVSIAEEADFETPIRTGGGKKFSQAHLNAMAKVSAVAKQAAARPRSKPKPKSNSGGTTIVHGEQTGVATESPAAVVASHGVVPAAPTAPPVISAQQLQGQKEWHILQLLQDASKTQALPTAAARFKRKLQLKRLKSFLQLPLFDMESYMRQHLISPLDLTPLPKSIPPDPYELRRLRQEQFQARIQQINHTPYGNSFASRLYGQPATCLTRRSWEPQWKSPFSGKVLKDFIWRDYESRSAMMDILDDIQRCKGRPAKVHWANVGMSGLHGRLSRKRRRGGSGSFGDDSDSTDDDTDFENQSQQRKQQQHQQLPQRHLDNLVRGGLRAQGEDELKGIHHQEGDQDQLNGNPSRAPIDYCYFRKEHLAQVNETLCRRFWPGIDMTEALQYPEYSVVVLYKRLVVGCAFMTPEGYITYVAVSAGWEKAGIGQYMLYHLMQASDGKDITLHVSANNPAMIMYQKFGFKPEQFLVNFYKEYLPENSTMCHNAFLVRLRR